MDDIVTVSSVKVFSQENSSLKTSIDTPKAGAAYASYFIKVSGWIVGSRAPSEVRVKSSDRVLERTPVNIARPDIQKVHSNFPKSDTCGFSVHVSLMSLPNEATLTLEACIEGNETLDFASITLCRKPVRTHYTPHLNPIIVSALGRSGTTLLMSLLSKHPEIVVDDRYPYETRAALSWMQLARFVAQPTNSIQKTHGGEMLLWQSNLFNPNTLPSSTFQWTQKEYPEQVIAFFQKAIDHFYGTISASKSEKMNGFFKFPFGGKTSNLKPRFFAEKNPFIVSPILSAYPIGREILLVRDFRDMVCSVLSFNKKRGYDDFGRQHFKRDEDYVSWLANQINSSILPILRNRDPKITYLLKYEDLIAEPASSVKSLFLWLNIDHSDQLVKQIVSSCTASTKQMKVHTTAANAKASIGRWKDEMNSDLLDSCNLAFSHALKEFGYTN